MEKDLIQLALQELKCSQKELAQRLDVSPAQISKWKKDEYMSFDMREKIGAIINLGEREASFVLATSSFNEAEKWESLIDFLAEQARESAETGYNTYPLEAENLELLCSQTVRVLMEMGISIPKEFPETLVLDYETADIEALWVAIDTDPYASTIYAIYKSLNDVYGFFAAYISDFIYGDKELDLLNTPACNIESELIALAACKIKVDQQFAPKFQFFQYQTRMNFESWLNIVKNSAFQAGIPLEAELLNLIHQDHDTLGHHAEAKSLGVTRSRIHPDIYMNELLTGMRIIHQILPVIMKKLDIYDDFQIDESDLTNR